MYAASGKRTANVRCNCLDLTVDQKLIVWIDRVAHVKAAKCGGKQQLQVANNYKRSQVVYLQLCQWAITSQVCLCCHQRQSTVHPCLDVATSAVVVAAQQQGSRADGSGPATAMTKTMAESCICHLCRFCLHTH
jgi:hypothetical protein